MVSYCELPDTDTSLPSYFAVNPALIGVPSTRSPVLACFTPPSTAPRSSIRLFTGIGGPVYLDFSRFSFQAPIVLSAPRATTVLIAKARDALIRVFRIVRLLVVLVGHGRSVCQWCPVRLLDAGTTGGKLHYAGRARPHPLSDQVQWGRLYHERLALGRA